MKIHLTQLRKIFEREENDSGFYEERDKGIGSCSTLINQLLGEPLFLALFAECLTVHTEQEWSYILGDASVARDDNKRSNRKRLDGFIYSLDSTTMIPPLIACEVKGWSDHCLGAYSIPKSPKRRLKHPTKGEYYWQGLGSHFRVAGDNQKEGVLRKLDAKWDPPTSLRLECDGAVGLAMYHLIEPPEEAEGVEWPFLGTRSVFWLYPQGFSTHERVLVFSVERYIRDRESDFIELNDDDVNYRVDALRRIGVFA